MASPLAVMATDVIAKNINKSGPERRAALAAAFVYALLDVADALRGAIVETRAPGCSRQVCTAESVRAALDA